MDEVENNSVSQEVAPQQTESHDQQATTNQQPESTKSVDDRQDRNWREMRRRQADLERELQMQKDMNEKLMAFATQSAPKTQQEPDELDQIADDDFIPKGKVNKLIQRQARNIAQEIVKQETDKFVKQQSQANSFENLKRRFTDFDEVVNAETLTILEEQEPELAKTIVELNDPYKIGVQSYKYIKAMGITDKASTTRHVKEAEKKLEKNAKTVQSPQAYDKRPMAQAFKLTDSEKNDLYREMMGYASQAGSVPEMG